MVCRSHDLDTMVTHYRTGFEHELTQNAQRLLEVCTQEIKKVHKIEVVME